MKAIEIAQRVMRRLSDPANWTSGRIAETGDGYYVNVSEADDSCRFCVYGAFLYETRRASELGADWCQSGSEVYREVNNFVSPHNSYNLIYLNDYVGREAMLACLEEAIQRMESQ